MKRSFTLLTAVAAASAIGIAAVATSAATGWANGINGKSVTYTLTLDSTNNVLATSGTETTSKITTTGGNEIAVKYANYTAGTGWGTFAANGYIQNTEAVTGIEYVAVDVASGTGNIGVTYSGTQWFTGKTVEWETVEKAIAADQKITLSPNEANGCEYFKIWVSGQCVINSITVKYTCGEATKYYGEVGDYTNGQNTEATQDGTDIYLKSTEMAKNSAGSMLTKSIPETAAHYSLQMAYTGNAGTSADREIDYGVVAYYKDENNYLVMEAQYRNWDRPTEIRSFVMEGKINGESYQSGDDWANGNNLAPNAGGTMTVEVTTSAVSGTTVAYTFTNGAYTKTGSFAAAGLEEKSAYIGLHAYNDVMKTSDLTFTKLADPREEVPCEFEGLEGSPSLKQYSTGEIVYSGGAWCAAFAGKNVANGNAYSVSADMVGTISTDAEVYMGMLAYYRDSQNYLIAYMGYATWDRPQEIRSVQMTGFVNGVNVGWVNDFWCDGSNCRPNVARSFSINVAVSSTSIVTSFNLEVSNGFTKSGTWTVNGTDIQPSLKAGLWCQGDTITYSNVVLA